MPICAEAPNHSPSLVKPGKSPRPRQITSFGSPRWAAIAAAAAVAFLIGISSDRILHSNTPSSDLVATTPTEVTATGYAVLQGLINATGSTAEFDYRAGDVLSAEIFDIASSTARIDFFSGAQIYLEGDDSKAALNLLLTYTGQRIRRQPTKWQTWLDENRDTLRFSDTQGYQWISEPRSSK